MNNNDLNASNSDIIFEATDFDRSLELILFHEKDVGDDGRFQLHIWNADTDQAIVMDLSIDDISRLAVILDPFNT